jgi:hypothetical protein
MSATKLILVIICCGLGTAMGWWGIKASWLLSLAAGPLQHLGLALTRLDHANEYLDEVSRVGTSDYIFSSLQACLWLIGLAVVFYWFNGRSKVVAISLACGWVVVGALNVYLFAIRCV